MHTPESFEHQYDFDGEEEVDKYSGNHWEKYLDKLEEVPEDIRAIGITDYMSVDGYERVVQEKKSGRLDNFDLILPNIEFRLDDIVVEDDDRTRINLHVLFNNELDVNNIRDNFLHELHFKDRRNNRRPLTRDNLERLGRQHIEANPEEDYLSEFEAGCKIATVSFEEILDKLDDDDFRDDHLIVLATDGWDEVNWNTQAHLTKERLFRESDALFSSSEGRRKWALGITDGEKQFRRSFGKPTPCIWGSDAHRYDRLCKPDENQYCWIKGDLSFEGLRQIVHEPERRVRVQEESPRGFTPIHTLDNINITDAKIDDQLEIADRTLPLNKYLITVIGGKGAGKTALLDLIATTFQDRWDRNKKEGEEPEDRNSFVQRIQDKEPQIKTTVGFTGDSVEPFSKRVINTETFDEADIEYLPQGQIEKYCRDKDALHERILQLIKRGVKRDDPEMVERFDDLWSEALDLSEELRSKTSDIYDLNPSQLTDEEQDVRNEKQQLIGELKSKKAEISDFEERNTEVLADSVAADLRDKHEKIEEKIEELNTADRNITKAKQKASKVSEVNQDLQNLEEHLDKAGKEVNLPRISTDNLQTQLEEVDETVEEDLADKESKLDHIESKLDQQNKVQREYSNLLDEKADIEEKIEENEKQMSEIQNKLNKASRLRENRNDCFVAYVNKYAQLRNQYQTIIDEFETDSDGILDDLLFEPTILISEGFEEQLERHIDLRYTGVDEEIEDAVQALRNAIRVEKQPDRESKVKDFLTRVEDIQDKLRESSKKFEYENTVFSDHLRLVEEVYFRGSPMPNLSLGQKGTVLLKILLAEDDTPLIIDQPEENLDNEFIYETLVGAFRDAKLKRQVIIATHNANLVVNTDAEQVIVANYDENTINFEAGALENPSIRNKVTTILEGGQEAFRRRRRRYEINKQSNLPHPR